MGFYASYDTERLHFAFTVADDDVAPPQMVDRGLHDGVRIMLDTHHKTEQTVLGA